MLLYQPDKNALEWKALARACETLKTNPVELLARAARSRRRTTSISTASWPRRFPAAPISRRAPLRSTCPRCPPRASARSRSTTPRRPRSTTRSRSRALSSGNYRIGVHIAAPALAIARGSADDAIGARAPVDRLHARPQADDAARRPSSRRSRSRRARRRRRCRSTSRRIRRGSRSRTRRSSSACRSSPTCACPTSTKRSPTICHRPSDPPWTDELRALWKLARQLGEARGKADVERIDYSFDVDWDTPGVDGEPGRVAIVPRPRGSPARQARRRIDDPRERHVGTTARRRRLRRDCIGCSPAAR